MVASANGEVLITNDGATILNKMSVQQPAAKMLVELAKSQVAGGRAPAAEGRAGGARRGRTMPQWGGDAGRGGAPGGGEGRQLDVVAGDGTTSVVVICGALLKKAQELLAKGVHPTVISDAFSKAVAKANEVLESVATPVDLGDKDALIRAATTSLSSKVVSQYSSLLSPMAVEAVLRVMDPSRPNMLDLRDIKVVAKVGGTIDDSELVEGCVFDTKAAKAAGGPTRVEKAKIGLIQFQLSPPKADIESSVVISDYQQMDRVYKEERNYILGLVKKIRASGCNVLLIQKSILRDAVTDLSLHYLAKAKIMVVRDIERDDIEFISKTLGCLPIAHPDHMRPDKLGSADLVEDVEPRRPPAGALSTPPPTRITPRPTHQCGKGRVVKVTGIQARGRTATVLLRGSNRLVLDEADRSLHDALCCIRCLVQKRFLIAGGSAPEVEVTHQLSKWAKTLQPRAAAVDALLCISVRVARVRRLCL
ncbi:T-complex protein 1 subunit delta [Monoraphidium neglectum]|uniref:T-complex protein 1 subunit delta n=1 Tax=Monoraphidium neglectum TaxID=145388 RepID=A0A0D2KUY7_9CHLO|nr:T-complex protein 1 subunit delta [Monoraphidium neglectum]KIY99168.1 T-complex protein 1 subunit delta [Monoraphidium neglectum]|eukprot:XP_013898188.1 T-complex protein 1 subunit delta [Monoraphidium neglectum]